MQLNFTGKDLEVTAALKSHITQKFANLERHYHGIQNVHVILRIENVTQIAEANLHIDHTDMNATAEDKDMYKAIDNLVEKLAIQLAKHKNKIQDKRA